MSEILRDESIRHVWTVLETSLKSLKVHMAQARSAKDPSGPLKVALLESANVSKAATRLSTLISEFDTSQLAVPVPAANSEIGELLDHLDGSALEFAASLIEEAKIARLAAAIAEDEEGRTLDRGDGHQVIGAEVLDRREWLSVRARAGVLSEAQATDLMRLGPITTPTDRCPDCGLPAKKKTKRKRTS